MNLIFGSESWPAIPQQQRTIRSDFFLLHLALFVAGAFCESIALKKFHEINFRLRVFLFRLLTPAPGGLRARLIIGRERLKYERVLGYRECGKRRRSASGSLITPFTCALREGIARLHPVFLLFRLFALFLISEGKARKLHKQPKESRAIIATFNHIIERLKVSSERW